jgi:hypothetical protein
MHMDSFDVPQGYPPVDGGVEAGVDIGTRRLRRACGSISQPPNQNQLAEKQNQSNSNGSV